MEQKTIVGERARALELIQKPYTKNPGYKNINSNTIRPVIIKYSR